MAHSSFAFSSFLPLFSVALTCSCASIDVNEPNHTQAEGEQSAEDGPGTSTGGGPVVTGPGGAPGTGVPQPITPVTVPETPETPETPMTPVTDDCDPACSGDLVCTSGLCGCPIGQDQCESTCSDHDTDTNNCGECGNVCEGATPFCSSGTCTECADSTQLSCGGSCVDVSENMDHCGECDRSCSAGAGEVCAAGKCEVRGSCAAPDISSVGDGRCGLRVVFQGALYECASSNHGSCGMGGVFCQVVAPNDPVWGSTAWSRVSDCP